MRAMLVRVVSVLYGLHQIIEKVRKDYVRTEQAGYNEGKDLSAILNYSEDVSGIKTSDPNYHN